MNSAITVKNEATLSLPDLEVPVMKQTDDENARSGNTMLEEHVIGSKAPLIMLECKVTKGDDPQPTDADDGELKPIYVEYSSIKNWTLDFTAFLPQMSFTISTERDYNCKVGNKVWLCLVPMNKNTGHEKIKMQFTVTSLSKTDGAATYICTYYVDNLHNTYPLYYNDKSSYDIAMELTKELQIGFRSNVDTIEDTAWYKSNTTILNTLTRMRFGTDLTDLFTVYIDEDNCFNLVNMYNIKTNIEDDFTFNLDVDVQDTDNNDFKSYTDMRLKFSNYKAYESLPTYISKFHKAKMTDGANAGDNFVFRYIDIDEYGMPTVNNSQMEYEESEGKTVLHILGEQTKEDVDGKYVNKELLAGMCSKAYNKLFSDLLIIDTKHIYGLKRNSQVLVDIYQYDGLKKAQGKLEDGIQDDPEIDTDKVPVKDEVLSGQYLVLNFNIYYKNDVGHLRSRYTLFKIA